MKRWLPFYCQCRTCLETFDIQGIASRGIILKLEDHQRISRDGDGNYYHLCGGERRGTLALYPALKYPECIKPKGFCSVVVGGAYIKLMAVVPLLWALVSAFS